MLEVNVGLSTNDGGTVSVTQAIAALQRRGFVVVAQRVVCARHAKGSEDTLVARLLLPKQPGTALTRLYFVAKDLRQDAIAVMWSDAAGILVGPRASEWGSFDPYYFHRFNELREVA